MGLSKRERMLALATAAVVGVLGLYALILEPVAGGLRRVENRKLELQTEVNNAQNLLERRRVEEQRVKKVLSDGLGSDTEAESRIARALDKWSADARLTLTAVRPERTTGDKGLKEITFAVAGTGRLEAVAWFLYQIETAELPIKVKDMQLGSTSESSDSMSLQLRLSTLYLGSAGKASPKPSQSKQSEKNDEEQILQ